MTEKKVKPLLYYVYVNGDWQQVELPIEVTEMRVGTDPDQCEIQMEADVADEVQVLMKRIGSVWYFIELGKNPMMKVNGVIKRQAQLEPRSSLLIQLGGFIFIFATKSDKLTLHQTTKLDPQFGPPQEGEFGLKGNNQELRYPENSICLIGSNPLCDFNVPTKALFCGFISLCHDSFVFHPLVFKHEITISVNGLNTAKPVKIKPKSMLVLDTYRIDFKTPGDKIPEQAPQAATQSLALFLLNDNGEIQKVYPLPESGSSIYAGRAQQVSHIVIEESKLISRKHAQIVVFDDKIQLVDVGAKNGLFINDETITNVYVHPGELFRMADLRFLVGFA